MNLQRRLDIFRIDQQTKDLVRENAPFVRGRLDSIAQAFYGHFMQFPETQVVFADRTLVDHARRMQIAHWTRVLDADFDDFYFQRSVKTGQAHERAGVPPFLFIAGYNFFLERVTAAIMADDRDARSQQRALAALSRVVALDMEISLSAYTREVWRHAAHDRATA